MTKRLAQISMKATDKSALGRFWAEALGWKVTEGRARLRSAKAVGPYLEFIRTPDAKTGLNRVHLDIRPYPGDDQAAEADRLRALGATDLDLGQGDVPWTVLTDPEGNEFCVLTPL